MNKKGTSKLLAIIITLMLLIGLGIGFYFVIKNASPQTVIPSQCSLITNGQGSGSFKCPVDASCLATVSLACTTSSTNNPMVIFRTNARQLSDYGIKSGSTWIAIKGVVSGSSSSTIFVPTSELHVYCSATDTNYGSVVASKTVQPPAGKIWTYNTIIYPQGGYLYVYFANVQTSNGLQPSYRAYSLCDNTATLTEAVKKEARQSTPIDFYKLAKQEVYDGELEWFSCSQSVTGSKTKLISYSESVAGSTKETFALNSNEVINWVGPITYTINKYKQSECTQNIKATSNSYYECLIDSNGCGIKDTTAKSCGAYLFNEATGECQAPTTCITSKGQTLQKGEAICTDSFTLEKCSTSTPPTISKQIANSGQVCRDGIIGDAYSVTTTLNKQVLSTSDNLQVEFASNLPSKDVTATIYKQGSSTVIQTKTQQTSDSVFNSGKTTFNFDTLSVGYYTVKISFSDTYGNYQKSYDIQVTEELTVLLDAKSLTQFDNTPIEVILKSYRSGSLKDLTNKQIEATFNGQTVYPGTTEHPSLGILNFYYDIKGDGNLRIRAKGSDEAGMWTDWTEYFQIEVKKSTILISTDFVTDVCTGSQTNNFNTKDSQGNDVNTNNIVTINKPLGGTDTATVSGKDGKYSFTYNFVNGGLYIVRITSSNADLGSSQLNSGQGQTINILTGASCEGGGGDNPTIPWGTILIIGVLILGAVLFIYFVLIKKK